MFDSLNSLFQFSFKKSGFEFSPQALSRFEYCLVEYIYWLDQNRLKLDIYSHMSQDL